jgi:hypothetical protein
VGDNPRQALVWDDEINPKRVDWDPEPVGGRTVWDEVKEAVQSVFSGPSAVEQAGAYNDQVRSAGSVAEALQIPNPLAPMIVGATDAVPLGAPQRAGNVNLDRVEAPDETKNVLVETAEVNPEAIDAARRGTVSWDQTKELARVMGMTEQSLLKRRRGQAFNAEEAVAARNLLVESGNNLIELAKKAKGGSDEDVFAFKHALTKHQSIQEQVSGMTAEAGRSLSSFNIAADGKLRADAIKKILESDRGKINDIADKMSQIDDPELAAQFAAKAYKATTFDKIYEIWINALLSGPQTQVVNATSNALVSLWTIPETAAAGVLSMGRSGNRVYPAETAAKLYGLVEGGMDAIKVAAKTFKEETPQFSPTSKIEASRYKAIPGKAGEIIRIPGRLLMTTDDFFKTLNYRMELNALALRSGKDKGLHGRDLLEHMRQVKESPPENIELKARDAAEYMTFSRELGAGGSHIMQGIREVPVARVIMPFVRTPTNIVKFAAERSPAAFALKEVRDAIKAGGAERDMAIARIAMGSSIGATLATTAAAGFVTGGGPSDPRERAMLYATGWRPYSIKVGDDYYAFNRLEPLGMILGISADFAEIAGELSEAEADEVVAMISGSISKNLVSKTWLTGLSDTLAAIQDPDQYGEQWVQGLAGTVIPTGVAQANRVLDPVLRDTQTVLDKIKSRIPGYSDDLPPRRNLFGEPITLSGGLGPDILSPIYTGRRTGNLAAEEMVKLKVAPGMPARKIEGVDLTPEQYDEYVKLAGQKLQAKVETVIKTPEYKALSDDAKGRLLEDIVRDLRTEAAEQMTVKYPNISVAAEVRRAKAKAEKKAMKAVPR